MIDVTAIDEGKFSVVVTEDDSKTEHTVTVSEEYYDRLTNGEISKEEMIRRSFEFLLKREPKESILKKFNLKTITKYFPEYEEEISVN